MRDNRIDLLRFIGLAMIVLAHVDPPDFLFQLRNFDVPLMVLVSGMSFGLSVKNESYFQYVWKRAKRLLIPLWIFLTGYFIVLFLINPASKELSANIIIQSYCVVSGIGYLWIIRIFLQVALVAPFIYSFHLKVKSDTTYFFYLLIAFGLYAICRYFSYPYLSSSYGKIVSILILYPIPYLLIFAGGLRLARITRKQNLLLLGSCLICFFVMGAYLWHFDGGFVPTQKYKYPASIYYLSYACAACIFFWLTSDLILRQIVKVNFLNKIFLIIAQNSFWFYLWHIPMVKTIEANYFQKYLMVFIFVSCIVIFQVWLINNIVVPKIANKGLKSNIKKFFTG